MHMKPECEVFSKKVVPVLRARIAQSLANDFDMQQYEIAKKLGVTQAAVSFYLSRSRGASSTMIRRFPEIDQTAKKMAAAMVKGLKEQKMTEYLCDLCRKVRKKKAFGDLTR